MSKKILINVNDKFGEYIVIDDTTVTTKDFKLKYHVKCSCGKIEYVRGYFLRSGRQKCCKSCRSKINYNNALLNDKKVGFIKYGHQGVGEITKMVYTHYKVGALKRNLIWDDNITIEYLWNLYNKQNKKCALSGLDIKFSEKRIKGNIDYKNMTASLDRIDSNIGYLIDNIQWVHKDINLMKNNLNEKYFIDLCNKICEFNK